LRADGARARAGWSVAYAELDGLLSRARLGRLVDAGYDFALVQRDPASGRVRIFVNSRPTPLDEPAISTVRSPGGFSQGPSGASYLELQIRPRAGWYPASELATAIGLLAVVTWLLSFATHDLTHSSRRMRAALAVSRRQLHVVNQRLTSEIEQRENLQKSFDHARYHDAFTGLPNRRYFMDQLDRAMRDVRTRRRHRIAIVLIDIDRFRLVNDTLGHTAGDELMLQSARRFEKATAALECVLARWGGDQFAVLVFDAPSTLQEVLREPFDLRRHRLSVTARMGVTCVDAGPQRAEDVLREADIALSVAKRHESAKAIAYVPTMGGDAASLVSLEADLHVALERHEFRRWFQPVVDLRAQRMVGAEALLRWRHPVEGLLRPDKFLAIAEEAGLIVPITRWIIWRVCVLASEWRRRLPQGMDFYISINLSATVLRDPGLSDYVARVLAETHTPAGSLKFELTEGGLISNVGAAREVLDRLHNMGIQLMLDDFGTGYSSLNYLQLFPFDYVKIDRPLVNQTGSDPGNNGILAAMVQMASSLGLKAIAETIETQAAAQALRAMGCDFAQGYFFCAPVEAEEALQRLRGQDFKSSPSAAPVATPAGVNDDSPTLVLPVAPDLETAADDDSPLFAGPPSWPRRTG
jgi:diguanylate cyclase (GGDEF)-like protein